MLTGNHKIDSLKYDDITHVISERYNITLPESVELIKNLSFKEYTYLLEANVDRANIPSPSGVGQIGGDPGSTSQNITPSGGLTSPSSSTNNSSTPNNWNGAGEPGNNSAVAYKDQNGNTMQGQNIGKNSDGTFRVKDNNGQEQNYNLADLLAIKGASNSQTPSNSSNSQAPSNPFPKTLNAVTQLMQSASYEDKELSRLLELAGIKEDASCGGTAAGSIASIAKPLGGMKKRQPQAETVTDKTIHGKIDPNAATGELSRRLVDKKLKTATRKNNGKKIT